MSTDQAHNQLGTPRQQPYPYQFTVDQLTNPLWTMWEVVTVSIKFPPKTDKNRTAANIFNYPSRVEDINKSTMLPLPRGFLYLDKNIAIANVTEPGRHAAFTDTDDPYPMLTKSYNAPEILQRIFETPTDPEYNKFTQQVFVKARTVDVVQLAALHEVLKSYALFVIMEDKHGDRGKTHLHNLRYNYSLLDVHLQQHIMQILAPPPNDKIVTHYSALAKYPGEDEGTDWKFVQSSIGRTYIRKMTDFWVEAQKTAYKNMHFKSDEQSARDVAMENDTPGGESSDDTSILTMMQQGGDALRNNNNLADKMNDVTGKDSTSGEKSKEKDKNKTKNKNKVKKKVNKENEETKNYVPETPDEMLPSHIVRSQYPLYEQARRKQLEIEKVVDRLYAANQFDETKYTAVCKQWHDENNYTIQQVEEDLKLNKFKKAAQNEEKTNTEDEGKQKERHVHFVGSQFGHRRNKQYNIAPPNPSYIPNRHTYGDYDQSQSNNQNNQNYNNDGNDNSGNYNYNNGNYNNDGNYGNYNNTNNNNNNNYNNYGDYGNYNYNGGNGYATPGGSQPQPPKPPDINPQANKNNNNGNRWDKNSRIPHIPGAGNPFNNNYDPKHDLYSTAYTTTTNPRRQPQNQNEEQKLQQLQQQAQQAQKALADYMQGKQQQHQQTWNKFQGRQSRRTAQQQQQQQLNQQFENIARRHRPADKQQPRTFNNPQNERDLAGSIENMLNGNQLPARQHTGTLPSDPIAAIPTPIPPSTPMQHRYPTMMDNNNDIFNFTMDNVNQIDNYINDFDYHLNASVTQRATPTESSIALNTSLVLLYMSIYNFYIYINYVFPINNKQTENKHSRESPRR